MTSKWTGVIALIAVLAIGAWAATVYLAPAEEGAAPGGEAGPSWHATTVFAAAEPAESGIENVYFMDNAKSYDPATDLSGHENLQLGEDDIGVVMTSGGTFTDNLKYENAFHIVPAVKAHDAQLAYVQRENVRVELRLDFGNDGTFEVSENKTGDTDLSIFGGSEGGTYMEINAPWDNNGAGYQLSPDEDLYMEVELWTYY